MKQAAAGTVRAVMIQSVCMIKAKQEIETFMKVSYNKLKGAALRR